jgi:hypothetical protein
MAGTIYFKTKEGFGVGVKSEWVGEGTSWDWSGGEGVRSVCLTPPPAALTETPQLGITGAKVNLPLAESPA